MKTVHLLRHAKSDWAEEGLADHERPLAPRGVKAAGRLREYLDKHPLVVDLVLCSTARRARETLELIRPALGVVRIRFENDLYGAGADQLLARLRRLPRTVGAVMLVGHNPGMEMVASLLVASGSAPAHFPTGALATLQLPVDAWAAVREGEAKATAFVIPKEL